MALNATQPDGATLRDHLLAVARQRKVNPEVIDPRLADIQIPPMLQSVWIMFWELSLTRGSDMAITYTEILAYKTLHQMDIDSNIVSTLNTFDRAYLAAKAEVRAKNNQTISE